MGTKYPLWFKVLLTLAFSFSKAIASQPSHLSKRDLPPDYYGGGNDFLGGDGGNGDENDHGGGGEHDSGMNIACNLYHK